MMLINSEYESKLKSEELKDTYLMFQGKRLSLDSIRENNQKEEILPGIYIILNKSKILMWLEHKEKSVKSNNLQGILRLMSSRFYVEIRIERNNKRDALYIENKYNTSKKLECDMDNEKNGSNMIDIQGGQMDISPLLLPYPNELGSGGCCIYSIFSSLGLLPETEDPNKYVFFHWKNY